MWLLHYFFEASGIIAWLIVIAAWLLARKGHNIASGW
jgi:hypothetical protein